MKKPSSISKKKRIREMKGLIESRLIVIPSAPVPIITDGAPMDIVDAFAFMAYQHMKRDQYQADQL